MRPVAYSQAEFPPFAAVRVQLGFLLPPGRSVPAKLDTGSTITVAPRSILHEAGALATGRLAKCLAYDGSAREWPLYEVHLTIADDRWPDDVQREFRDLLVLGVEGQTEVLLGRDVLAAWQLHLDGPQSRYSVE